MPWAATDAARFDKYLGEPNENAGAAPAKKPEDPFAPRQIAAQSLLADGDDWPQPYTAERRQAPAKPLVELIPGFAEKHVVTFLEGLGGVGKSLAALQDALCISTGGNASSKDVIQKPALYLNYEEDEDEYKRRLDRLIAYLDTHDRYRYAHNSPIDTSQLYDWQLKRHPRPIMIVKQDGAIMITRFGNRLLHWLAERRDSGQHTFVVFDGIIDAICFAGNTRNDDAVARQVIAELDRLALEYDFSAYAILHPSRAGECSGTGSYAPAWSTKPRAIQSFTKVELREDTVLNIPKGAFGVRREVIKRSHGVTGEQVDLYYDHIMTTAACNPPTFRGAGASTRSMLQSPLLSCRRKLEPPSVATMVARLATSSSRTNIF